MALLLLGLTLLQPRASMIALGFKHIETRSWPPPRRHIGHLLAIHAGQRLATEDRALLMRAPFNQLLAGAGYGWGHFDDDDMGLPRGAVVAVVRLADIYRMETGDHRRRPLWFPRDPRSPDRLLGLYEPGRWLWYLTELQRLDIPVPVRGHTNLWPLPPADHHKVLSQTKWRNQL